MREVLESFEDGICRSDHWLRYVLVLEVDHIGRDPFVASFLNEHDMASIMLAGCSQLPSSNGVWHPGESFVRLFGL